MFANSSFMFYFDNHIGNYSSYLHLLFADAFGESGRLAFGDEGAVGPNATLQITLELVSWKVVFDITKDKKVLKKILKEGEGYEQPNDGAVVQGIMVGSNNL